MPSWKSSVRRSQSCSTSSRSVAASTASIRPRRRSRGSRARRAARIARFRVARACAALAHLGLRHELVGEADPHRLLAGDAASGIEQQRRLLRPDEARQGRGQAEAGVEAEPVEIGAEPRLLAGDAEIRHAARGRARRRPPAPGSRRRSASACGTGGSPPCTDAGPGARRRRRGGRSRRRRRRPCPAPPARSCAPPGRRRPLEGGGDLVDQRDVEEIVRRPLDLDDRDMAGGGDADAGEGHGALARWEWEGPALSVIGHSGSPLPQAGRLAPGSPAAKGGPVEGIAPRPGRVHQLPQEPTGGTGDGRAAQQRIPPYRGQPHRRLARRRGDRRRPGGGPAGRRAGRDPPRPAGRTW